MALAGKPASIGVIGDCSQVAPRLYLGNAAAAADTALLEKLGVTFVLNVADDLALLDPALAALYEDGQKDVPIERQQSTLLDAPPSAAYLTERLDTILETLTSAAEAGSVLVHCVSGRNRSSTIVCALLMAQHRCTMGAALAWLQRARNVVHPCTAYQSGLLAHEDRLKVATPDAPLVDTLVLLERVQASIGPRIVDVPLQEAGSRGAGGAAAEQARTIGSDRAAGKKCVLL